MCCSYYAVRRVWNCIKRGRPVQSLNWCKGRPKKQLNLSLASIEWICSRSTLRRQVALSLKVRAGRINRKLFTNINADDLRLLYKQNKVTVQQMRSQLKPSRQFPLQQQRDMITNLQAKFLAHLRDGKHIVQYDECVFSVNHYKNTAWAPSGRPLLTAQKYYKSQLVVVCGFISVESGKIMMKAFQRTAFKAEHIKQFFSELKAKFPEQDIVCHGDNASIHKASGEHEQEDVEMLFNVPY